MSDLLGIYVEGNLIATFVKLAEVVIAMDVLSLVVMVLGKAKDSV